MTRGEICKVRIEKPHSLLLSGSGLPGPLLAFLATRLLMTAVLPSVCQPEQGGTNRNRGLAHQQVHGAAG